MMAFILAGEHGDLAVGLTARDLTRAHRRVDEASLLIERLAIGADLDIVLAVSLLGDGIALVLALPDIGDIRGNLLGRRIPFVDAIGYEIAESEKIALCAVMPDGTLEKLVVLVDFLDLGIGRHQRIERGVKAFDNAWRRLRRRFRCNQ